MIGIDQMAYRSALRNENPRIKLAFSLMTLGVLLSLPSYGTALLVMSLMSFITVNKGRLELRKYGLMLLLPLGFLGLSTLTMVLGVGSERTDFYWAIAAKGGFAGITRIGLQRAGLLFANALAALTCLYFLILNTPMVDLLADMRRLGVPKLIIALMELMYRFITLLTLSAERLMTAQKSRLGYAGLRNGYRSMGMLSAALFFNAMRHTDRLHRALESRGYDGEIRVLTPSSPAGRRKWCVMIGGEILLIAWALVMKALSSQQ